MPSYIKLLLIATIISGTVVAALQRQRRAIVPQQAEEIDASRFPVADSTTVLPADPSERAKREAISRKYNSRHVSPQITESTDKVFLSLDWDVGLPALPVGKSSSVIIGEITKAEAHMSEDKTAIYSEFAVRIESILKNDTKSSLTVGSLVSVERL